MTAKAKVLGHEIHHDGKCWRLSSTGEKLYTPELASGGQTLRCIKCLKMPTPEGHDGCLGTLPGNVMNACCGHGDDRLAYIQWDDGLRIGAGDAIAEQKRLIAERESKDGDS